MASTTTTSASSKTYKANCHCGAIKYTVEVSPPLEQGHEVMSCDCSICTRDGKLNIYIPKEKVHFVQGQDAMKTYDFLTLTHYFCPNCGTSLFCHVKDPKHEWADELALSVRAFNDIDISALRLVTAAMKDVNPKYDPGW